VLVIKSVMFCAELVGVSVLGETVQLACAGAPVQVKDTD
jgi:hypothetical protein